ncbi:MAG: hypothetical protein NT049_18215, partial [Planctomycetota bacterium]|nr:hypothetical protein [Planctomycetota bacterium]
MLLAVVEAAALTMNFYFIFSAYLRRLVVAVSASLPNDKVLFVVALVVTSVFLAGAVFQGTLFVRGRAWARSAFLIENGAMILLGLLWFIHSKMGRSEPNPFAVWGGL